MTTRKSGKTPPQPRVVVIGIGNLLLKDEGVGVHAVRALLAAGLPPEVKIIDGGISPDIIALAEGGDKLIVIDAARGGGAPGTIYRLGPQDLSREDVAFLSAHDLGVAQSLRLMEMTGGAPGEIAVIGVEPKEIDWGMELSPQLQQKLPQLIQLILEEIGPKPKS